MGHARDCNVCEPPARALRDIPDARLLVATEGHWGLCACSWCAERERRAALPVPVSDAPEEG